jgi:hypothetical protein
MLIAAAPLVFVVCRSPEEKVDDAWTKAVREHAKQITAILNEGGLGPVADKFNRDMDGSLKKLVDAAKLKAAGADGSKPNIRREVVFHFKVLYETAIAGSERAPADADPSNGNPFAPETPPAKGLDDKAIAAYKKVAEYIETRGLANY